MNPPRLKAEMILPVVAAESVIMLFFHLVPILLGDSGTWQAGEVSSLVAGGGG